jgi:hypothetical protein
MKNSNAFGKQETRDVWKLRGEDDEEKPTRRDASALKQLDALLKKEAQVQQALEAAQKKVEKQNAKAAKTVAKLTAPAKKGASGLKAGRR